MEISELPAFEPNQGTRILFRELKDMLGATYHLQIIAAKDSDDAKKLTPMLFNGVRFRLSLPSCPAVPLLIRSAECWHDLSGGDAVIFFCNAEWLNPDRPHAVRLRGRRAVCR